MGMADLLLEKGTAYPSRVPGFTPFFEKLHVARHLNLTTMHFLIKGMILCSVLLSTISPPSGTAIVRDVFFFSYYFNS
jgi:hypothetical protein